MNMKPHKLILVGDEKVGKTTFINQGLTCQFEQKYIPTKGAEIDLIAFPTNMGEVTFEVHDITGQDRFADFSAYFREAECAIVMFRLDSKLSYKRVKLWIAIIRTHHYDIPIVLCGNKCDLKQMVKKEDITLVEDMNLLNYHDISAKSGYQIANPFLYLIRYFHGNLDIGWIN